MTHRIVKRTGLGDDRIASAHELVHVAYKAVRMQLDVVTPLFALQLILKLSIAAADHDDLALCPQRSDFRDRLFELAHAFSTADEQYCWKSGIHAETRTKEQLRR